jgi:hypothetical protein
MSEHLTDGQKGDAMRKLLTFVLSAGLSLAALGLFTGTAAAQSPYRGFAGGTVTGYGPYGPRLATSSGYWATPGAYRVQSSYAYNPGIYGYGPYFGGSGYAAGIAYPGIYRPGLGYFPVPVARAYDYNVGPFGGYLLFSRLPY